MTTFRPPLLRAHFLFTGHPGCPTLRGPQDREAEPPGPTETIRTPTRLTSLTPPPAEDGAETWPR